MPIYEYRSEAPDDPERSCRVCARGFELRRPVDRTPLTACPLCKHPVRKVISRISTPTITKPLLDLDATALAEGALAVWPNKGVLPGNFASSGSAVPAVVMAMHWC